MRQRVFLDASALLAGAYSSPTGAMRVLIRLTFTDLYLLYTNEIAVEEAERILQNKAPEAVAVFRALLAALPMMIKSAPRQGQIEHAQRLVAPAHAPLLAGALDCKADYLVTFDRQLIGSDVSSLACQLVITTPGDMLHMPE